MGEPGPAMRAPGTAAGRAGRDRRPGDGTDTARRRRPRHRSLRVSAESNRRDRSSGRCRTPHTSGRRRRRAGARSPPSTVFAVAALIAASVSWRARSLASASSRPRRPGPPAVQALLVGLSARRSRSALKSERRTRTRGSVPWVDPLSGLLSYAELCRLEPYGLAESSVTVRMIKVNLGRRRPRRTGLTPARARGRTDANAP
jgi:hypothetical protein